MNPHSIRISPILAATMAAVLLLLGAASTQAQGTAFTYQGRLDAGNTPATGLYDFEFHLYSAASGGGALTGGTAVFAHPVTNGLFTVTLDFLNSFPGADRWLEIAVKTNGGASFQTLTPRQKLTPTPYAITAGNITGTLPSSGLSGAYNSQVTLFNPANQINGSFNGTFTGNGAGVSNVNAAQLNGLTSANFWQTNGNLNANPTNGAFVGTRDNLPLEVKVNGQRAQRFEPVQPFAANGPLAPNVIGGSESNRVLLGARGATIAGGGPRAIGEPGNTVSGDFGTIGGGRENQVRFGEGTVAGGRRNLTEGFNSTVGGGFSNAATTNYATVSGGVSNLASGIMATVAGGIGNAARGLQSTVSGGERNQANGPWTTVIGGSANSAMGNNAISGGFTSIASGNSAVSIGHVTTAAGPAATALGNSTRANGGASFAAGLDTRANGNSSTALGESTLASGPQSTALGHFSQALGWRSTAMGAHGVAAHDGTFVWNDGNNTNFQSTAANQFLVNAVAGVGINTNNPQAALHVGGGVARVEGLGGEAAYLGGDGAGFDVQVGSFNPGIGSVALWNAAVGDYMTLYAKDAFFLGNISGSGAGLTGLPAAQLSGTIPDANLSANVALRNGGNTFNGNQTVASGNLMFNSANSSITYPAVPGANSAMINLFASGTANADRMVLAHSPTFSNYGLQYRDSIDQFNFLGAGFPILSVGLSSASVGIGTDSPQSALDVRGTLTAQAYAGNVLTITPLNDPVNGATANFRSGSAANIISNGVVGGLIAGGGNPSYPNRLGGNYASVLGGSGNTASGHASVAMGDGTTASGRRSTGMGEGATAAGDASTAMGAGTTASGLSSTAMGYLTRARNDNATAMGQGSIADGWDSLAFGTYTVAGGHYSTAGGHYAQANHQGSFVWADSTSATPFASTGDNQFLVRASGGVGINTSNPNGAALAVNGTAAATTVSVSSSIRVPGAGIGTTGPAFVHRVTAGNIDPSGNHRTTIDHPLCNGDANAILIITHNYNPGNTGGTLDTNPTSVYYNGALGRWQIYHDNLAAAPMTVGNAWNVLVFKP